MLRNKFLFVALQLFIQLLFNLIYYVQCGGEEETTTTEGGTVPAYTVAIGLAICIIHSFVSKMM
ncbi:unnamed protein product [Schistosoma turkestanicum]|nr:unnamed protein product [Schistosoma turkestanicum]